MNVGAMALALLLTMLVAYAVARQITRQLQGLREAAQTVAFERLPAVVHELRITSRASTISPDQVAARSATSVRAAFGLDRVGVDEIGSVVQAFAEVHQAAVRTAAEQAIMRANTADIFVHLSRRCQRLVDSLLAQVDVVERDETDPDRLRQLYELDNLATRMSRINASLLVLGGVGIGRVRSDDVPLPKILQAGLSQIQHYTRVRFGIIDQDVSIVAEAVDDVVHLFAELMDNATCYSPPDSEAWITARSLGDRVIVQIGDEGVGLPPQRREALNDLLLRPPAVDVAAIRSMGLVVVGHLAARFGARVELRSGPRLGTIAEVTLTPRVFRTAQPSQAPRRLPERGGNAPAGALPVGPAAGSPPPTWPPAVVLSDRPHAFDAETPQPAFGAEDLPRRTGAADDTTAELPIFEQVNNWFHPRNSRKSSGPTPAPAQRRPPPAEASGQMPTPRGTPRCGTDTWRTRADEAWRAATALGERHDEDLTPAGLPQRVPQRHLVPQPPSSTTHQSRADQRDPTTVAAALSAYARGVAGRQMKPPGPMPAGRTGSRS